MKNTGKASRFAAIPDYDDAAQMDTGTLRFDGARCTRCRTCLRICPARSILMDRGREGEKDGLPYLDCLAPGVTSCVACGACAAACPEDAISVTRGFNAGSYYARLSQGRKLTFPRRY